MKFTNGNKANATQQITWDSSTTPYNSTIHVNMAKQGKAGRKLQNVPTSPPFWNDLSNWIMDSGWTCHILPFRSDFIPTSFVYNKRTVQVADGSAMPAKLSGTIIVTVFTESYKPVSITQCNVLFVPQLSRRLFSLVSLIEQGHDVQLS